MNALLAVSDIHRSDQQGNIKTNLLQENIKIVVPNKTLVYLYHKYLYYLKLLYNFVVQFLTTVIFDTERTKT